MNRPLAALAVAVLAVAAVPIGTARLVEWQRRHQLELHAGNTYGVPPCPPGEQFSSLVEQLAPSRGASGSLWKAVCRAAAPSAGVLVVAGTAREVDECAANIEGRFAHCWLEPTVSFLSQTEHASLARILLPDDGGDVLWQTTMPLEWSGRLEAAHRRWLLWSMLWLTMAAGAYRWRTHWIETAGVHRALRVPALCPPARLELLLVWIAPPSHLPQEIDDLRETYREVAARNGMAAAGVWYAGELARSAVHYAAEWARILIRG